LCPFSDKKTAWQESVTLPYLTVKIPYETEKSAVILLCCAVLCCAVLCCAVLCCAVLCCAVNKCKGVLHVCQASFMKCVKQFISVYQYRKQRLH